LFQGSPVAELIKQRPAQPGVNWSGAYKAAREWISECFDSHENCPKQSSLSNLPTRVLDLSAESGTERIKLKISKGAKAQYAALSYCWGSTKQMTTTLESLLSFTEDGIEIKDLPKTLQDAIHVCRNLELRYIWIDSLCILQDSAVDKAVEISMMPQIYKGATVTISAAVASDCGQGFLEDRSHVRDVLDASFPLPYALKDTGKTDLQEVLGNLDEDDTDGIFLCPSPYCGFNVKEFEKEPINQRAWTLQESWLSPRLLIYGAGPLQWQCLSAAKSFGGTLPSQVQEDFFPTRNRHKFIAPRPDVADQETLSSEWMTIVSEYTGRSMTDPQDKLPALSGIAAEFGRLSGDEYVAGLWASTLPYSLLWHQVSQPPSPPNETYRAPSWSWAAVDGVIRFEDPNPWVARTEVKINSVSITPATSLAPLANVIAEKLILTGPMRSMTWEEVQERFVIVNVGQSAHMVN
jgi:hypothetical protein